MDGRSVLANLTNASLFWLLRFYYNFALCHFDFKITLVNTFILSFLQTEHHIILCSCLHSTLSFSLFLIFFLLFFIILLWIEIQKWWPVVGESGRDTQKCKEEWGGREREREFAPAIDQIEPIKVDSKKEKIQPYRIRQNLFNSKTGQEAGEREREGERMRIEEGSEG